VKDVKLIRSHEANEANEAQSSRSFQNENAVCHNTSHCQTIGYSSYTECVGDQLSQLDLNFEIVDTFLLGTHNDQVPFLPERTLRLERLQMT